MTTALLLAAGKGSRLNPLTHTVPKCMTEVNGSTLLERLISNLEEWGFKRLIMVVGHLEKSIRDYVETLPSDLTIEFVENPKFEVTNNIYSLWLARNRIEAPFLLMECDLVFDPSTLEGMLEPDRIAVSHIQSGMNGSRVHIDPSGKVERFFMGDENHGATTVCKTVNIYSFSSASWQCVKKRLEHYIMEGHLGVYYETVFAEMIRQKSLSFQAVYFDPRQWHEIDTLNDLRKAEALFPNGFEPKFPSFG